MVGTIVNTSMTDSINPQYNTFHVDFGKKIKQAHNKVNSTTHTFYRKELKPFTGNMGSKKPTHLVTWEEDEDPAKYFTSEKAAIDFVEEELLTNSDVDEDSIILVEIKSAKRVVSKRASIGKDFTI